VFQIELRVAEGLNFPYYVMGKAQLRILPFADPWVWIDAQTDPYALFAREYGAESSEVEGAEELWYNWLSQTSASCPDDARQSLEHSGGPLFSIARGILREYLERWPAIHERLTGLLRDGPSKMALSSTLRRNEELFRLSYPENGREVFHFTHFPTTATQKPGPHFVFGLGCLSLPEGQLLGTIAHEVGNTLLQQIVEDEGVASYRGWLDEITREDRYVRGYGSLVEALNWVIRAIEREGSALTLDDIRRRRKPGEEGIWRITESLFRHRHLWPEAGLVGLVCAALESLR
jgi:hypothetical protein